MAWFYLRPHFSDLQDYYKQMFNYDRARKATQACASFGVLYYYAQRPNTETNSAENEPIKEVLYIIVQSFCSHFYKFSVKNVS